MLQTYEGYFEDGRFYPIGSVNIQSRRRVLITVLNEPINEVHNTWAEFDRLVLQMSEKPRLEDFPRCHFGRAPIDFEEV